MGVQHELWAWVFNAVRVWLQSSNKILVTRDTHESKYHSGYKACATALYENPKIQWEKWERIPQPNAGALTSGG